ncbi:MAG: hypothetical protein L0Y71_21270, partial [Gemmataceae bacterium]|nr:hypothetical protein [Gemmataceae bacterium]
FQYEEEQKMRYVTSIERIALKEAREEGREEGREGILEGIEFLLEEKFGSRDRKLLSKVRSLGGVPELRRFLRFLKDAKTLEEVRSRLVK